MIREGDRPDQSCVILEGWLCRYRIIASGRRQILSLHVPGDVPDLMGLHLAVMDHTLSALTPAVIGCIPYRRIDELIATYPRLAAALWRETLIDAAQFRGWMVGLGRREALSRIAHLICEMYLRMQVIGLTDGFSFRFPVKQVDLADATGLSDVHVNRTLQELRRRGLLSLAKGDLTILDWEQLKSVADFDPQYLHLGD